MYSTQHHHPGSASMNGGVSNNMMDGSGTINPAALNQAVLPNPAQGLGNQASPRGIKRSHSPSENYSDAQDRDDDDSKPRKRGRPPKKIGESPISAPAQPPPPQHAPQHVAQPMQAPAQTPQQLRTQTMPQNSPPQASPPAKPPATKPAVIKALPTVRDHTTDQLNPEGDEYIPREYDDAGEKKAAANGTPLGGREYRCRTFLVPNRGNKLFMLATECARVLNYRDSYLLFNKNRSLFKIIATQAEKDDLIAQEILPYSYRSRQIAIVTARSMFRQFGSRLIVNGRRVRDDYWESKARKQGFTEEDAAGEKRPGAARQREAAAAEASQAQALNQPSHDIVISGGPTTIDMQSNMGGMNPSGLPMISSPDDLRFRDYGNVQRPRHEISGPPYHDRTQGSTQTEILNQATHAAEFNKAVGQQRNNRSKFLDDYWRRPHDQPLTPPQLQQQQQQQQQQPQQHGQHQQSHPHQSSVQQPQRQATAEGDALANVTQSMQSPHMPTSTSGLPGGPPGILSHGQPGQSHLMGAQGYQLQRPGSQHSPQQPQQASQSQQTPQQPQQAQGQPGNPVAQSPMRSIHQPLRPDQMHQRSPSMGIGAAGSHNPQTPSYGYANQMWHQQQPPQPSPLSQHHSLPQYGQHAQQQSPHAQQSTMHSSPQLQHTQSTSSMHGQAMGYQTMGGMGGGAYPGMSRSQFPPNASSQQFMQSTSAQQPGMQGWAPPTNHPQQQQGWQQY